MSSDDESSMKDDIDEGKREDIINATTTIH